MKAVPAETVLLRINAKARGIVGKSGEKTAFSQILSQFSHYRELISMTRFRPVEKLGCLAIVIAIGSMSSTTSAAEALPAELQYVPADAALFIHADAAQLWQSPMIKSLRAADKQGFGDIAAKGKKTFGVDPDSLKTITVFWPKLKGPGDTESFVLVLVFSKAYNVAQLEKGLGEFLHRRRESSLLLTPSDKVAVYLSGLKPDEYGKRRPADKDGPLTAALREAGNGKHLAVFATTLASMPDEIRGDAIPPEVRPFKPLFDAQTIAATLDLGKEL